MSLRWRLSPSQSPVVCATIAKRNEEARASSSGRWGSFCIFTAAMLGIDLHFQILQDLSGVHHIALWYGELVLLLLLLLSALYDVIVYLSVHLTSKRIQLTPAQKRLLRVGTKETGFDTVLTPTPFKSQVQSTPIHTPSTSPLHYLTPTGSARSSVQSTPHSTSYLNSQVHTPTPSSTLGYHSSSAHKASPFSGERIGDLLSLESYLRDEEDKEQWVLRGSPDLSSSKTQGYWYGRQASSHTASVRKYHVATRTQSPSSHRGDGDSPLCREISSVNCIFEPSLRSRPSKTLSCDDGERVELSEGRLIPGRVHEASEVWAKLGIKREDLDMWTENCRKWLAQTVLGPVAREIETINTTLSKIGSPELQIGSVSLGTLRQVARSKAQHVPTLAMVIPYLELSSKQEYLVQRIKELARGGYISAYRWNSGGSWKGRNWDHDLPSDSQIVMHLLCTYLDNHMPRNPRFPDGRPFSSQYFLKVPDKPASKKADVCIYQVSMNPPQYQVLLKDLCVELPKGRNNLFHAVIVFLYHIKNEEKAMLGQINLNLSGINILWIVNN